MNQFWGSSGLASVGTKSSDLKKAAVSGSSGIFRVASLDSPLCVMPVIVIVSSGSGSGGTDIIAVASTVGFLTVFCGVMPNCRSCFSVSVSSDVQVPIVSVLTCKSTVNGSGKPKTSYCPCSSNANYNADYILRVHVGSPPVLSRHHFSHVRRSGSLSQC